ncbi:hypothetical protein RUND412_002533 [Rhizina undulata]
MSKPTALLLGKIDHARKEWDALSSIAELKEITTGTRDSIIQDLKDGKWDGVLAIYRTYDSVKITGRFDEELVGYLPKSLVFLCHNGAGYDQIDVEACINVSHTPKAVDNATANVAMMLLLNTLRKSWIAESALRAGNWRGAMTLGNDPDSKTLGILGLGGIGTAFSTRCVPFGLNLIYHNRHPVPASHNPAGARYVPNLDEFLGQCDIISIHLPLTSGTHHFLGREQFAKMKRGVVIINTARGAIIDEAALVRALEEGRVGGAGLDVFEEEPKIHQGLMGRGDVVLFPHIGTATWETQHKMESLVIENVKSAIEKGVLLTQVPEQKKAGARL